jgi:DNA-binding LacI/PurR family transcriptional regulator
LFLALSVIGDQDSDTDDRSEFLFQQERVDGVLILTPLFEKAYVSSLQQKEIPFVIMDNQVFPYTVSSIVTDNFKGGYDVTRHLLESGHEKIACIGGPENLLTAEHRVRGFLSALHEVGLEPFVMARGDFDIDTGYKVVLDWIYNDTLPTGIICGDDHIAFGVIDALRGNGIRVPEDVSVIGYDDHPFASKLHPHLTTVKQPAVEMGQKGVEALLDQMHGAKKSNLVIKLEPKLIIRSTTSEP